MPSPRRRGPIFWSANMDFRLRGNDGEIVILAYAGIHFWLSNMDSRLCGNDDVGYGRLNRPDQSTIPDLSPPHCIAQL